MLTHGSLFSGIGGFDLGFERAGIETIWQVEIEDYARRVLQRHFPRAQRFNDIRECGKHNLAPVDIVSGGFPCQPFSCAGPRKGQGDNRYLWPEMLRVISAIRPAWVVAENVYGFVSMRNGAVLDEVYTSLESEGYEALPPLILPASSFGAGHRRDRVWIIAHSGHGQQAARRTNRQWAPERQELESDGKDVADSGSERRQQITTSSPCDESADEGRSTEGNHEFERTRQSRNDSNSERAWEPQPEGCEPKQRERSIDIRQDAGNSPGERLPNWAGGAVGQPAPLTEFERPSGREIERDFCGMAHGVSKRVDRLRGLGNAIVPQISEWIGRRIVEAVK